MPELVRHIHRIVAQGEAQAGEEPSQRVRRDRLVNRCNPISSSRLLARRIAVFKKPRKAVWTSGDLEVNVSPELWLEMDDVKHVVKLYFKAEKLCSTRPTCLFAYLRQQLESTERSAYWDLQQGRLFKQTTTPPEGSISFSLVKRQVYPRFGLL